MKDEIELQAVFTFQKHDYKHPFLAEGSTHHGCGNAEVEAEFYLYWSEEKAMTFEEAVQAIQPGRYRHFKGNEYEVIGVARYSETEEPMVVYKALYGEGGLWVRPAEMWNETVERDGKRYMRFERV